MKTILENVIANAIEILQQEEKLPTDLTVPIEVERTRDPKHGDFASNIALLLAKPCKKNPKQIAELIIHALPKLAWIVDVQVANPGFINFSLADAAFQNIVKEILAHGPNYGHLSLGNSEPLHIEIVSANPTGPLHVGHGRIAAYGASLANVLETAGFKVHREYYVNDAGRQMRILAISVWLRYLQLFGVEFNFPTRGYKGDYVLEIAKQLKTQYGDRFNRSINEVFADLPVDDEEHQETFVDQLILRAELLLDKENFRIIFEHGLHSILDDIREDLQAFGVNCQEWFHESQLEITGDIAHGIELLKQGDHLYSKDGAVWFRTTTFGDEKDRVVIRENGQPTYFASDVGYHFNKLKRGFMHLIDVYGADHHGYIPRLEALIQALGEDVKKLHVLLVQFAILYRGKTRVSMSTRGGDFVTLRELRSEVGNDAARFFYIMRRREQHLDFDLELAKSQSSDNPVYYIQYAHARVCSVFRQLEQKQWQWDSTAGEHHLSLLLDPHEKNLMRGLSRYPEAIAAAATAYEPAIVAHFLQELAYAFHAYYNNCIFLVTDVDLRNARLCLIAATRQVLANGLGLLGLSAPDIM